MVTEHARASATDGATLPTDVGVPARPVDDILVETAGDLAPGRALDLGCGAGQNAIWLARRGWTVGGVDISETALAEARATARGADVRLLLEVQDITRWRPRHRYDLVVSTFALPARGSGRSRMLEMAVDAVAPGGTIVIRELDTSLGHEGWMAQKHLVSIGELERAVDGFRVSRAAVRLCRHMHGHDERVLPVATLVATRRRDLRTI